jgi:hypothetical protein
MLLEWDLLKRRGELCGRDGLILVRPSPKDVSNWRRVRTSRTLLGGGRGGAVRRLDPLEWFGYALMALALATWRRARDRWVALVLASVGVVLAALGRGVRELTE